MTNIGEILILAAAIALLTDESQTFTHDKQLLHSPTTLFIQKSKPYFALPQAL